MRKISNIWLITLIFIIGMCFIPLVTSADDSAGQVPPAGAPNGPNGGDMTGMLKNLTEQGFDVSTVQAAVDSGDKDAAKKALDEFFQAHPEAKPKMPAMPADRLKEIVQNLSSKGDVSTIQAALDSGDTEKAQKLLDEFWQQHPDAKPAPPEGGQPPQQ